MKKWIFLVMVATFLLLTSSTKSTVVEVMIEYENVTTTSSTTSSTTTTIRGGGGVVGGKPTTVVPVEERRASLGYEMPASFEIFKNDTVSFTVMVKNLGTVNLTNITLQLSGIPSNSFTIRPTMIDLIEPGFASHFTVSIDSTYLEPGNYTLTLTFISTETSETTTLLLIVKQYTKEIGEKLEEVKKYEEVRKSWTTFKFLFISILIVAIILLGVILYFHRALRCPVCGTKLKKEYEDKNFAYYKCLVCGYRRVKLKR